MKRLRDWIKEVESLCYVVDELDFSSSMGRNWLLDRVYSTDTASLEESLSIQRRFIYARAHSPIKPVAQIAHHLSEIRDIRGTIASLCRGGVLTEVELFELKRTAYYTSMIISNINDLGFDDIEIPSLDAVFNILNPQGESTITFHLYDEYSTKISDLRMELRKCELSQRDSIYNQIVEQQNIVLSDLSHTLSAYVALLEQTIEALCYLDFLIAATTYYTKAGFVEPKFSDTTTIRGVFNPLVKFRVAQRGGNYQPIDIDFGSFPTIIKGANMCGKSVILDSVALCQLLAQFGLFVPALFAELSIKEDIFISMADSSSLWGGLSSFGAEILSLDRALDRVTKGENILLLVDEAARTTNPVEGVALISALCDILKANQTSALITTHYSGVATQCRFLRVKGLSQISSDVVVGVDRLDELIDYSLEECSEYDTPQEALKIARLLGVSSDLIEKAKKYI